MNSIKYNTRNRSKPVPDLINYFSSSDDDLDDDLDINFIVTSNHKPIFGMRPRKRLRKSIIERNFNEFASSTPARRTGSFVAPSVSPIETGESDSTVFSKTHRDSVLLQMQEITSTANSVRKRNSRRANETRKQVDSKNGKNADDDYELARTLQTSRLSADRTKAMPETHTTEATSPLNNADDARRDTLATHVQTSFLTSTGISPKVRNVLTQTTADRGTQITHSLENSGIDSESDNSERGRRKNVLVDNSKKGALRRTRTTEMSLTICAPPHPRVNNCESEHDSIASLLGEDESGQVNYGKINDDWVAELLSQHLKSNVSARSTAVEEDEVQTSPYLGKELAVEVEQLNVENIDMPLNIAGVNNSRKKVNIIEDQILAVVDIVPSDSLLDKENIQPVKAKKSSKRYKELITAESTEDLSQGLRRSKRERKQRVIDYPTTVVIEDKRFFKCITKDNHAFRARGLTEASQQQLESYYKMNKSNVTGRNASKRISVKTSKLRKTSRETKFTKNTTARGETKFTRNNKRENPIESTITEAIEQSLSNSEAISHDIQPSTSNVNVPQRNSSSLGAISTHHQSRPYFYFPQDNKVCKIDYFSGNLCFNAINESESIRMAAGLKSSRAGFQSGMLEIQPGQCKPKDMTVKFALTFFVFEGRGVFYVHDSYSVVQPPNMVYVPLGAYYSIWNQSHTERLRLYYVKIKPRES